MRVLSDLLQTLQNTFGINRATIDASVLTTGRTYILPDASGTLSLGGGGGTGIAEVDFGVNGASQASVFIVLNDAAISIATTVVLCGVRGMNNDDHTYDEHLVEEMDVRAGNIVNEVGFQIYAVTRNVKLFGKYKVFWRWL